MTIVRRIGEPDLSQVYRIGDTDYVRVSRVLEVIAKPSLNAWRRRVGFEEADRISRDARDFGTRLHQEIETWLTSWTTTSDLLVPLERWHHENVEDVLWTERRIVHRGLGYAGTADAGLLLKDGRRVVVDWKSSNGKEPDPTYALQTSAYMAGLVADGEQVDGRLVVQLPSKEPGVLRVHEFTDHAADFAVFRAALRIFRWQQKG